MAILHKATLLPGKLDLLREYLKTESTLSPYAGDELTQIGAYRFDDPAGQVGIETHVLSSGSDTILHIPLVYRNDALEGAEAAFVGTMEHSVLGTRWVYDATIDPIYAGELLRTILTGGSEVELLVETPEGPEKRDPSVKVRGSGSADSAPHVVSVSVEHVGTDTRISTGDHTLSVARVLAEGEPPKGNHLLGTWTDQDGGITLAHLV